MKIQIWKDSFSNSKLPNQDFALYSKNSWNQLLFAIADGVGSLSHSNLASQTACQTLADHFVMTNFRHFSDEEMKKWGENFVQKTLFQKLQTTVNDIATTLSFIIVVKDKFYVFHIGNTRIFQFKHQKIHQITTDHVQSDRRLDTFSWLKRENLLDNAVSNRNNCYVDFSVLPFEIDGLLLTTDGLHDFVTLKDLQMVFQTPPAPAKIKNIIQKAHLNGSLDDKTFLYVAIHRDRP